MIEGTALMQGGVFDFVVDRAKNFTKITMPNNEAVLFITDPQHAECL